MSATVDRENKIARLNFILKPPETISQPTYAAAGQTEKAAEAFRSAVKADALSPDGIAAKEELEKLIAKPVAVDSQGTRRPDRFPQLTSEMSPIIVAATFTIANHKGGWSRNTLPASLQTFLNGLEKQSGMLGMRMMGRRKVGYADYYDLVAG